MKRLETALKYFNEQKELTDIRIKNGIELYRKGDAEITFITATGILPQNITIEIEQKNHEFKFGANLFMLDEFECKEKTSSQSAIV